MTKRRTEEDEWELHKSAILDIYVGQNGTLQDVMTSMALQGFKRTKSQYERTLKKWGVQKNITKDDCCFIVSRLGERQGRDSVVKVAGLVIPQTRLQKQIKVHGYQTTYERELSKVQPPERRATPPHIQIYTPSTSPLPTKVVMHSDRRKEPPTMPSSFPVYQYCWTEATPWRQCVKQLDSLQDSNSQFNYIARRNAEHLAGITYKVHLEAPIPDSIVQNPFAPLQSYVDGLFLIQYLTIDAKSHPIFHQPIYYLPWDEHEDWDLNTASTVLLHGGSQLQILKLILGIASNNHDVFEVAPLMVGLARRKDGRALLRNLLSLKLPTVDAFAEKLLVFAVQGNNLPLVKLLVEREVDVNTERAIGRHSVPCTALEYAIKNGFRDIMEYLLDHGATHWIARDIGNGYTTSVIDFSVALGDFHTVEELLSRRQPCRFRYHEITLEALSIAVIRDRLDLVNLLLDNRPTLLIEAKATSWYLLEAAAMCNGMTMFDALVDKGLDIHATDENGRGSALAIACGRPHMDLVHMLLQSSVNVNSVASDMHRWMRSFVSSQENELFAMANAAALHIATMRRHDDLVRLLIKRGADVNQYCDGYPIQIAVKHESTVTFMSLLRANANLNACDSRHRFQCQTVCHFAPYWQGHTATEISLLDGNLEILRILHERGIKIPFNERMACTGRAEMDYLSAAVSINNRVLVQLFQEGTIQEPITAECLGECIVKYGGDFVHHVGNLGLLLPGSTLHPAVMYAAVYNGDVDMVQRLLTEQMPASGFIVTQRLTGALNLAVQRHETQLVKLFIHYKVSPFEKPFEGEFEYTRLAARHSIWATSALFLAASKNRTDLVQMLLEFQPLSWTAVQEHMKKKELSLSLCAALKRGYFDIVTVLTSSGFNEDEINRTMGNRFFEECLGLALNSVLLVQYESSGEITIDERVERAYRLLNMGADPNFIVDDQSTILQQAANVNKIELVRVLIARNANVNASAKEEYGATALQFAAIRGNFEIVKMLLAAGANVNAPPAGYDGRTAIEGAAEWGRLDMTRYLLEAGADIKGSTNKNYRRTVFRAWRNGHRVLVHMIQQWKAQRYGPQDCQEINTILKSMTSAELNFLDLAARRRYLKRHGRSCQLNLLHKWSYSTPMMIQ